MTTIQDVKLSEIVVIGVDTPADHMHPLYDERAQLPPSKELMLSIATEGQKTPVALRRTKDGIMIAKDGRQRISALRKLGMETIRAYIEEDEDDSHRLMGGIWAANVRVEDRADHRAHKVKRHLESGMTRKEIASAAGVSVQRVGQWLRWFDLTETQQDKVLAGDISFDAATAPRPEKAEKAEMAEKGEKGEKDEKSPGFDPKTVEALVVASRAMLKGLDGVELNTKAQAAWDRLATVLQAFD